MYIPPDTQDIQTVERASALQQHDDTNRHISDTFSYNLKNNQCDNMTFQPYLLSVNIDI